MKKRTIVQAIGEALKREGKPSRIKTIYNRIIEDDLYRFNSSDPEHIVRTMLRRHCENMDFPSASKRKNFVFLNNGTFWIKGEESKITSEYFSHKPKSNTYFNELRKLQQKYNSEFKEDVLGQLKKLKSSEFENFCKELLTAYGFKNVKVTRASRDGGIDGHGELKIGLATMEVAFECKRWQGTVGRPNISQFRGDIQGKYQQGIYFTTSKYSKEAKEVSFQNGAVPIILIDGPGIIDIMIEKKLGVEVEELQIYTNALDIILKNEID